MDDQPVGHDRWAIHPGQEAKAIFFRVEDVGDYLDEYACEVAEYDDLQRSVKYTHPETQQDDALHATNYTMWLGYKTGGSGLQPVRLISARIPVSTKTLLYVPTFVSETCPLANLYV